MQQRADWRRRATVALWAAAMLVAATELATAATTLSKSGGCDPVIARNWTMAYPADFGAHLNRSYEYWWAVGYVEASDRTRYGYFVGVNRCSPQCGALANHEWYVTLTIVERPLDPTKQPVRRHNSLWVEQATGLLRVDSAPPLLEIGGAGTDGAPLLRLTGVESLSLALGDLRLELAFGPRPAPAATQWIATVDGLRPEQPEALHQVHPLLPVAGGRVTHAAGDGTHKDKEDEEESQEIVGGVAFLDHLWSTVGCGARAGMSWRWFFLQLDNGYQVVVLDVVHTAAATAFGGSALSNGTAEVLAPGASRTVRYDVAVGGTRTWQSLRTGIRYPVDTLIVFAQSPFAPDAGSAELRVTPLADDGEFFAIAVASYYEAPSTVVGTDARGTFAGSGTTELQGFVK